MKQSLKALPDKNTIVNQIKKIFDPEKVEELARKSKFVQRESQITGMDFFMLCLFSHQQDCNISLEGLANELIKEGKKITKQSVDGRFNDYASGFMKSFLEYVLSEKLNINCINHHGCFNRIVIEDSSQFQLPEAFAHEYAGSGGGASKAAIKIHFAFDLFTHKVIEMVEGPGKTSDYKQPLGEVKKTIYG